MELFGHLLRFTTGIRQVCQLYYLRTSEGKIGLENVLNLNRQLGTEKLYHILLEINFFPLSFHPFLVHPAAFPGNGLGVVNAHGWRMSTGDDWRLESHSG